MMNACLTAAGALRPTGNRTRVTGDQIRVLRVSTAPGEYIVQGLKIPKRGMLAQMNGHRRALVALPRICADLPPQVNLRCTNPLKCPENRDTLLTHRSSRHAP